MFGISLYKPIKDYVSHFSVEKCFLEMIDSFFVYLRENMDSIINDKFGKIKEMLIQSDDFKKLKYEQQTNKFSILSEYLNKKLYENNLPKKEIFNEVFKHSLESIHENEEKNALTNIFFN
jgi:uncharacterized protein YozE (UPF0346 family)